MSDDVTTKAYRVLVSFNALTKGNVVHLPQPLDEHNQALVSMGLLAEVQWNDGVPPWFGSDHTPGGTVMAVDTDGETASLLGVMSAPVASQRRTRRTTVQRVAEMEKVDSDGEGDS